MTHNLRGRLSGARSRTGVRRWAVEIKWSRVPRPTKGFHFAREALAPDRCFLVGAGPDRYLVSDEVEAIGLRELAVELLARRSVRAR